jgi:hypothetical protein
MSSELDVLLDKVEDPALRADLKRALQPDPSPEVIVVKRLAWS